MKAFTNRNRGLWDNLPILLLCLFVLLLQSCGKRRSARMKKYGAKQTDQDYNECLFEVQKATGNLEDSRLRDDRIKEMVDICMRSKGYASE